MFLDSELDNLSHEQRAETREQKGDEIDEERGAVDAKASNQSFDEQDGVPCEPATAIGGDRSVISSTGQHYLERGRATATPAHSDWHQIPLRRQTRPNTRPNPRADRAPADCTVRGLVAVMARDGTGPFPREVKGSLNSAIVQYICAIRVSRSDTTLKHKKSISWDRVESVTGDMGDQDRLAIDPQLSFEQYADLSHVQIYSLERYIRSTIISEQTRYSFVEISVDFIKRRPTSVLELVFKDEAGVKHKSSKFKEGDLVHWNLDTFVHFAVSSFS